MYKTVLALAFCLPFVANAELADSNLLPEKTVTVGETFTIQLPSNPTTGYQWVAKKTPDQIKLLNKTHEQSPECKEGMVGCGGVDIFHFNAVQSGKGILTLQYIRPWAEPSANDAEKKITIEVK